MHAFPASVVLAASAVAAVTDVAWKRIPNVLTVVLGAGGLALAALQAADPAVRLGLPSPAEALLCVAAALLVLVPLWRRRALGGGDAKLLVALAVWCGAADGLEILCLSCVCGLVLALTAAWTRGELFAVLGLARAAPPHARSAPSEPSAPMASPRAAPEPAASSRRFPFGVAVFAGACVWWIAGRLG